jgi:glycosyltransferase involved in cell wall biosynthesis
MAHTAQSEKTSGLSKVAILLATYNGAKALQEQLDSYVRQTHVPALLMVSDDGSTDATRAILTSFAQAHPDIPLTILDGPGAGAAQNFLYLLRQVPDWIDVAALSDQDDVWLPEKLSRGLAALNRAAASQAAAGQPLLYCGRSWECDAQLNNRTLSRGLKRPASFRHALVQSIAGGNTMMLDRAALTLCRAASLEAREIVVHDWWIYQIITGVGGKVVFDNTAWTLYRQHSGNLIGANRGFKAKKKRLRMLAAGQYRRWNSINIKALTASAHRFTPENRGVLHMFAQERDGSAVHRVGMILRTGLYRQGRLGSLSLYVVAMLRRI